MTEKYSLKKMLDEIKEDEEEASDSRTKLSRDGLKKLVAEKRKERKGSDRGQRP
ncbi:MAG: hypothetical protein JXB04_01775 [Kiritimatiellae bacterium]|nr:hypothetical protein [Kiritimatiellia bacterium]